MISLIVRFFGRLICLITKEVDANFGV